MQTNKIATAHKRKTQLYSKNFVYDCHEHNKNGSITTVEAVRERTISVVCCDRIVSMFPREIGNR